MQLDIVLTGKTITLWMMRCDTIGAVKAKIQDMEGISLDQQQLTCDGTPLEDDWRLWDCGLMWGDELHVAQVGGGSGCGGGCGGSGGGSSASGSGAASSGL